MGNEHDDDQEMETDGDDPALSSKAALRSRGRSVTRGPASAAAASGAASMPPPEPIKPRNHHAARPGIGNAAAAPAAPETPPNAEQAPWSREAELMLGEMLGGEHPRSLAKYGKTPYDVVVEVRRLDGAARSSVLATFELQSLDGGGGQTPGDAIRSAVTDRVHLPSAQGPALYEIWFMWRVPYRKYGQGLLQLPAPAEIVALRSAKNQQQQPQYSQQGYSSPPVSPPQQPAPAGYGAAVYTPHQPPYPQQPQQGAGSHDVEVSNLRAEVAGLGGAVRELMEYVRGERRQPPPPPPPAQQSPQPGMGAVPPPGYAWPRRPVPQPADDDVWEELQDLRDEVTAIRRNAPGVGATPQRAYAPQPTHAATPAPAPQPRVPEGPNGEIWVERVGWCIPKDRIQQTPHAAPPPAPAPEPVRAQTQPVPIPQSAAGMGALPISPLRALIDGARSFARDGRELRKVMTEVDEALGTGLGNVMGTEEAAPQPEAPADPADMLPFTAAPVEGAELFGHPVKYTVNKETGEFDYKNFVFANPGLMEKGVEILGVAADAIGKLANRAAVNSGAAAAQLPAGVGASPAQVVSEIPPGTQHANGASAFPRV